MASDRQLFANRLNAQRSTGPKTFGGKSRSRRNALKHGLTARTIVAGIENGDEFAAFVARIASAYRTPSPVHRELVERLAALLWRLRRAQNVETGLLNIQAKQHSEVKYRTTMPPAVVPLRQREAISDVAYCQAEQHSAKMIATTFLRLSNLNGDALDRLTRYETAIWRQAVQLIIFLDRFAIVRGPLT